MSIEFHRRMLADRVRHDAFRAALKQAIVPGKSAVADIGAGTGVLAFFARELGAREVWLYDPGPALRLAETVAARNGIDSLNFVPARSLDVEDPPRVDVVVAEVLGNFAYEEDVLETLRDAQRFLRPGGTLIPASIEQKVAPVTSDRFERDLCSWRDVGFGLDWSDAERMTRNNMYVFAIEPKDLLGMSNMWVWSNASAPQTFPETPWALDLTMDDFPYPKLGKADMKDKGKGEWFWESGFDKHPLNDLELIRDWNFRAVYGAFSGMRKSDPQKYADYAFDWLAYIGGTRESRLLQGDSSAQGMNGDRAATLPVLTIDPR